MLNYTRDLLALRTKHPALGNTADWRMLSDPLVPYPLVYERTDGKETFIIIINPREKAAKTVVDVQGEVEPYWGDVKGVNIRKVKGQTSLKVDGISAVICRVNNN
jgi:maltose alpha-D-glucosyltransferase/alpha-amylase